MPSDRELGLQAIQRRDIDAAIEHLERACNDDPNDYQAQVYLGAAYGDAKRFLNAINIFTAAVQLQPMNAQARYNLGVAMERGGYPDQAVMAMEQAIMLQPDYTKAHETLQRWNLSQYPAAPLTQSVPYSPTVGLDPLPLDQPAYGAQNQPVPSYNTPSLSNTQPLSNSPVVQPSQHAAPIYGATPSASQTSYGAPQFPAHIGAPQAGIPGPYLTQQGNTRAFVKDPGGLTQVLQVLLWITAGFLVAMLLLEAVTLLSISAPGETLESAQLWVGLNGLLALGRLVVIIITIVHFCKWIHRANTNVRGFGTQGLEFTPGWAVGWYFIPFANLVKPYQAMAEIWRASLVPDSWQTQPLGSQVGIWWGCYLVSNIVSNIATRLEWAAQSVPDTQISLMVTIASDVLDIVSAIAAIQLIRQIYHMQRDYVNHVS